MAIIRPPTTFLCLELSDRTQQFRNKKIMIGYKPYLEKLGSDLIREIVRRVMKAVRPEKILLFGSRARGNNRPESDIDLLVIQKSNLARHRRSVPIYRALVGLPTDVDVGVVVYTPAEIADWAEVPRPFVTTALRYPTLTYQTTAQPAPSLPVQAPPPLPTPTAF